MKDKHIRNILNSVQEPYNPAHWEAIRPELESRKERRSLVWPWYLLASMMMLAIVFLFWQGDHNSSMTDSPSKGSITDKLNTPAIAVGAIQEAPEELPAVEDSQSSSPVPHSIVIEALPGKQQTLLPLTMVEQPLTFKYAEYPTITRRDNDGLPELSSQIIQELVFQVSFPEETVAPDLVMKERTHWCAGMGIAAAGWLNPEEGRLWYTGASAQLEASKGAWRIGISPALLHTDDHFRDEWLPVDITDESPEFMESNAGAFAPMTVLQKQRVAFAPEYQFALPIHVSWQQNHGLLHYAIGPELGITHGWGSMSSVTESFLGLRGALGCQLGRRSYLHVSYAYSRPFSEQWTEINRASLTFNHFIK
ncbi:MAG TPA: hypothetical protein VJ917_05910 [Saprospiraceae bacterium]|nr:hypothetical protein [Saprospiraceae bacterium]